MVDQDRRLGKFATFVAGATLLSGCAAPQPTPTPVITSEPTIPSGVDLIVDCEKGPFKGDRPLDARIGEKTIFDAKSRANGGFVELELTPQDGSGYQYQVNRNSQETYAIDITGIHSFVVHLNNLDFIITGNQNGNRVTGEVGAVCLDSRQIS